MNLDNYFAKYLGSSHGRTQPVKQPAGEAGGTDGGPLPFTIAPAGSSSGHSLTSPAVPPGNPSLRDGAGRERDRPVEDESSSVPDAHAPVKRTRAAVVSSTSTPIMDRRRPRPDPDLDDDDMDLLLGPEEAQRQRRAAAMASPEPLGPAAQPRGWGNVMEEVQESSDGASSAVTVRSLPWSTRSRRVLEGIAGLFECQFAWELHQSPELLDSFEPFLRDRQVAKIAQDTTLRRTLLPPSQPVTATNTGALPGCVLRDYQVQGVQFLLDHFHRGMSCILSDDMGLGKTAQICSFLSVLKQQHSIDGPHLVVAPLSTLTGWTRELARWAPQVTVFKYHGERKAREQARHSHHLRHAVFVTTPAMLTQDKGFFRKRTWVTVTMDEAHVLKGRETNVTHTARKLRACFRVAVTGTPVHNNVMEVWSLMGFLYPSLSAVHAGGKLTAEESLQAAEDCARVLRHIMLRRTKESMELGIPPRTDEPVTMLEPTYVQSRLLAALTAHALREARVGEDFHEDDSSGGGGARQLQVHLSHQRAACNHPMTLRLLTCGDRASSSGSSTLRDRLKMAGIPLEERVLVAPSAKMVHLDRMLATLKADGHRCLIFSNFTATLDLLEAYCQLRHFSYERLDGSCNRVERELSMLRFNAPTSKCFIFLVTTTAGGVGVTLTGADTVILFDAHYNPQLDRQAADRAHRLGQTRPVRVYRLCLRNTVEEHIRTIADRKASLGDLIVDGGTRQRAGDASAAATGAPQLTAHDIRELLMRVDAQPVRTDAAVGLMSPTSVDEVERAGGFAVSLSQRAEEDAMVDELVRIELHGLPGGTAAHMSVGPAARAGPAARGGCTTHHCFVCADIMHPLEPLYHCQVCPKAYHADCIGMRRPKPGQPAPKHWTCPRHLCHVCDKPQQADGANFLCTSCPRSYCFDCLDPRYLALDDAGIELLHVRKTYDGMEAEGVEPRRSAYYISCLHCCGVAPSSSSDGGENDTDDSEDSADSDQDESSGEGSIDGVQSIGSESDSA